MIAVVVSVGNLAGAVMFDLPLGANRNNLDAPMLLFQLARRQRTNGIIWTFPAALGLVTPFLSSHPLQGRLDMKVLGFHDQGVDACRFAIVALEKAAYHLRQFLVSRRERIHQTVRSRLADPVKASTRYEEAERHRKDTYMFNI